jgi:signal transduction histidine kinase
MIQRAGQWVLLAALTGGIASLSYVMAASRLNQADLQSLQCISWPPSLVWAHLAGDALIALVSWMVAYALMRWMTRMHGVGFRWPLVLLATALFSGGLVHGIEWWSIWQGQLDQLQGPRVLSASTSIFTAAALMLALPGLTQLTARVQMSPTATPPVPASQQAMDERRLLEQRVQQRTAELQAAHEMARSALQETEQANRLKDTFLAMASHELRTPLQSTLYWAEMLKRGHLPDHGQEAANHIIHNVSVQSRLIDDLLDISRILTGQLRLEWRSCDPVDVVQKATEVVRAEALVRGIRIELTRPAQTVRMTTDPVRLEQVAWNLISNAVHASPDGALIEVDLQVQDGLLRLVVQDNGVGITPEQMPQIFETFRQGASAARHGGLGLGLPITRSIVRQFDGQIEAFSEGAGRGARFTVELPLRGAAAASPAAPLQPPTSTDRQRLQGLHVLYVEDKAEAAQNGRLLLASLGVQVEHCASFAQAARRIPQGQFDVLLSALRLDQGHSGEALIERLPRIDGRRPVAVALSAGGAKRGVQSCAGSGFVTHVVMPVTSDEMGRALLDAIGAADKA